MSLSKVVIVFLGSEIIVTMWTCTKIMEAMWRGNRWCLCRLLWWLRGQRVREREVLREMLREVKYHWKTQLLFWATGRLVSVFQCAKWTITFYVPVPSRWRLQLEVMPLQKWGERVEVSCWQPLHLEYPDYSFSYSYFFSLLVVKNMIL